MARINLERLKEEGFKISQSVFVKNRMLDKQFVLYQFTIETVSKALFYSDDATSVLLAVSLGGGETKDRGLFMEGMGQSQGETPLYAAAKNRHAGVVTEMLEYMNLETASVAARNGYDPLHVATEQGHLVLHSAAGTGAHGGCEVPPEQDPGTGHVCTSKKVQNKCFTVFLETLFTFCKTVSSSLTVQSASKEQGNCGLGPRRCSSQQRRTFHGMARHSAGYVM
uniref:Uncharacterized protein n=1 Tax=Salix viminalis TaxID=40686 RepID=A0A6N2MVX3_SALVM